MVKKIQLLALIIFIAPFIAFAQRTVEVLYVTNSNDTVATKMRVSTNLFDRNLINELSFVRKLHLVSENGYSKIKVTNIKYLEFTDFKNNKRIFESTLMVPEIKMVNILFERKIKGKLNWYRSYFENSYDGGVMIIDHYFKVDEEPVNVGAFNNFRKKLKEIITDKYPDLINKINQIETQGLLVLQDKGVMEVINLYNSY